MLSNPKHELFAQGLAEGLTGEQAQERAGYEPDRGNAARLTANDSVQDRVKEIQEAGAERVEYTVEAHHRKLEELQNEAIAKGQAGPAVKAEELRGRVSGFYKERHIVEDERLANANPQELVEMMIPDAGDLAKKLMLHCIEGKPADDQTILGILNAARKAREARTEPTKGMQRAG